MIPKIIWQTHEPEYRNLSEVQKNVINTWKNFNPDWEHRYVGAQQRKWHIKEYDKELYKYYTTLNKINQADVWRMVVIYLYGGMYADMDSVCIMSIDESIEKEYAGQKMICTPIGKQFNSVNNSNFASIKNNEILKNMIDKVLQFYIKRFEEHGYSCFELCGGDPCHDIFGDTILENQDDVFFTNLYLDHTEEYKVEFDPKFYVYKDNKKIYYLDLAKNNGWDIY